MLEPIDLDPGPDTYQLESINNDAFVASHTAQGELRFAFRIGGPFASKEYAGGMAVQPSGDFAITGSQPFGAIDFDPDPSVEFIRDGIVYVASYDTNGKLKFAVSPVGLDQHSYAFGKDVDFDSAGNVYVTGVFAGGIDFQPTFAQSGEYSSLGVLDSFFASYSPEGGLRFAFTLGGPGYVETEDIAVDSQGNMYLTGSFSESVQFDPHDLDGDGDLQEYTTNGERDLFIVSYNPDGLLRFAYAIGGAIPSASDAGYGISLDAADNVYVTGVVLQPGSL